MAVNWKRNLWLLWIAQLLSFSGYSAALPFIPLFIKNKYAIGCEKELGLYISAFYFISTCSLAIVSPVWGLVADRYGRKLMLLRAFFGNAVIFPLLAFAPTIGMLLFLRGVASVFSGSVNAAQTLIASTTPEKHQGFALGVFSTSIWSGSMLGLVLGGLSVHWFGYTTSFVACGVMYLIGGLLMLGVQENFVPVRKEKKSKWSQFQGLSPECIMVLGLFLAVGCLRNIEMPFLPLKVEAVTGPGKAELMTGILGAFAAAGGVISGVTLGKLADRVRPAQLLLPVLLASASFLAFQGASRSMVLLIISRFFAFSAAGGIEPVLQVVLSRLTPQEYRGGAFGWAMTARMVGIMVSSIIGGCANYLFGINGVFFTGTILFLLFIPLVLAVFRRIGAALQK